GRQPKSSPTSDAPPLSYKRHFQTRGGRRKAPLRAYLPLPHAPRLRDPGGRAVPVRGPAREILRVAGTRQLSSAGHMIRATAPVSFFHFDSSATSCFFPAAVKR